MLSFSTSLLERLKPFIIFPCQVIASVNIYFAVVTRLKPSSGRNTHENNGFFPPPVPPACRHFRPPMIHLCSQQEPGRGPLYINVCSWNRVPAPQDPSRPLPVYAGELEVGTDQGRGKTHGYAASLLSCAGTNRRLLRRWLHGAGCGVEPCGAARQ